MIVRYLAMMLVLLTVPAWALTVRDDTGQTLSLPAVPKRIVSLAPHATELLFAVGAGEQVVGVSAWSDWPAEAKRKPQVGDIAALDLERIRALRPDVVVAWQSGNRQSELERLRQLRIPLYFSEVQRLDDLPGALKRLGTLTGHAGPAREAADRVAADWQSLRARYGSRSPVVTFYQVWGQPLMTVTRQQFIGDVLAACGAANPFAALSGLTPTVSEEDVLAAAPQLILSATVDGRPDGSLDRWRRWSSLPAVRKGRLVYLPADKISRPTPRLLEGARQLCEAVDRARQR